MSDFEILYLVFGGGVILSGIAMLVTYTASFPWWRDLVGRMMVTYAAVELCMSALLMSTVVFHVGPHWFRGVWFGLQALLTFTFAFQTWTIVKLRRQRRAT